jgi:hypothetical protein
LNKEVEVLFCAKSKVENAVTALVASQTTDTGKIALGGACRLPVKTADTGKIRLGGACRLPVKTARRWDHS